MILPLVHIVACLPNSGLFSKSQLPTFLKNLSIHFLLKSAKVSFSCLKVRTSLTRSFVFSEPIPLRNVESGCVCEHREKKEGILRSLNES